MSDGDNFTNLRLCGFVVKCFFNASFVTKYLLSKEQSAFYKIVSQNIIVSQYLEISIAKAFFTSLYIVADAIKRIKHRMTRIVQCIKKLLSLVPYIMIYRDVSKLSLPSLRGRRFIEFILYPKYSMVQV